MDELLGGLELAAGECIIGEIMQLIGKGQRFADVA